MKSVLLTLSGAASLAVAVVALSGAPARAEIEYPWCASTPTGQSGTPVCRYATIEQCQAFLQGLNGSCSPNPRATTQAQSPRRSKR